MGGARVTSDSISIDACRSCGDSGLQEILDLGETPLANRLLTRKQLAQPEPRYPLVLAFCPACTLIQITETVSPEVLFSEYFYRSSFSDALLDHSRRHVKELLQARRLGPDNLVVEVASNDGYLLENFVAAGVPVLGIEPARNIAGIARSKGVPTRCEFFGGEVAKRLKDEGLGADVLLANNVLAHVSDLNGFVAGVETLLAPDGIAEFEFPYVGELVDRIEFDTIYHEHLCYFSAHAIAKLFERHHLVLSDVRELSIHGGSLRVTATRSTEPADQARVQRLLDRERALGLDRFGFYEAFGARVMKLKADLLDTLHSLKKEGARIAAYGASAKGSTLLNVFGIGQELLDYVVDRSTLKQGRYTPGTHLPIYGPEKLLEDRPDYALLLSWNFADEILEQQAEYCKAGGRFLIPVPQVRIIP